MAKRVLGVASIKLGAIAGDGGMGTALTAIGDTVIGSAILENAEGTTTDFFSEESDTPIESILSEQGSTTFTWSTHNLEADALVSLFGGTKTTGPPVTWEPPDVLGTKELSVEVIDKKGNKFELVRVSIKPKFTINFNKTSLGQVDIVGTILTPTKENTKPFKITYA